ncbi:aldose epimerase family protein [Paenibacillus mendelii]|uniref:Aldose epimerase n=1 Tax=Paenibacillus mendelii TaxID=206163 RepID=A0ABV6JD04_9BACL|nr:aldose epimerase [Paenibacillus mendelii]MCQ6562461.1 aldose epimerase [Paenibacillus mendelii]
MKQYEVRKHDETYTLYTLTEAATDSSVTICPERGAIAISCRLNGEELFYLDEATLIDPEANIRGGNPILFPISGQLVDGRYEWDGVTYPMRNHGVARNRPWEFVSLSEEGEAALTLRLCSGEATRIEYPFDFELLFTYALKDGALQIRQSYRNLSESSMPIYAGFHPYFKISSKRIAYGTDATQILDYNDQVVKPIQGEIDMDGLQESVALLDATEPAISFPGPEGQGTVRMTYSDVFKYVVLWQVEGKPFVCVEPWMALTAELNRKEELQMIPAGQTLEAELTIHYNQS